VQAKASDHKRSRAIAIKLPDRECRDIAGRTVLSVIVEPTDMPIAKTDDVGDQALVTPPLKGDTRNSDHLAHLEELLAHSVRLRDMYKNARWQTADIQFRLLRLLFDDHYREQLRLIDVLKDRIRMLGGADRILAGAFLQGSRFSYALRGRTSPCRLLEDLLDAHGLVLFAVRSVGNSTGDDAYNRDLAVGRVGLTNELQHHLIDGQLMRLGSTAHPAPAASCRVT
jgi:starvation-inducible DNA-binding protein